MRLLAVALLASVLAGGQVPIEEPLVLRISFEPQRLALGEPFRTRLTVVNRARHEVSAIIFFDNGAAELRWNGDNGQTFTRPAIHSMADYFPESPEALVMHLASGAVTGVEILSSPDPRESLIFYDQVQATCYSVTATLHLQGPEQPAAARQASEPLIQGDLVSPPARICFGEAQDPQILHHLAMLRSDDPQAVTAALNFLDLVRGPRVTTRLSRTLGDPGNWTRRFSRIAVAGTIHLFVVQRWEGALAYLKAAEEDPRFTDLAKKARERLLDSP